jgi:hypothetical protein
VRAIDRAGLFRYLIEEKVDVSPFKNALLSDDFGPAALPADIRDEMFTTRRSRIHEPARQTVSPAQEFKGCFR